MSDQPFDGEPPAEGRSEPEVQIDLTAFLPESVVIEGRPDVDLVAIESEGAAPRGDEGQPATPVPADVAPPESPESPDVADHAEPVVDGGSADPTPASSDDGQARQATDQDGIDAELIDSLERDLNAVDAALEAIDAGTYGSCAVCEARIAAEHLSADPVRRTCAEHA